MLNGLSMLAERTTRSQMGTAPRELILREAKLEVHAILPRDGEPLGDDLPIDTRSTFPVPVLLVPPLMVRPYVYDLRPDHSLVRALRDRGFRVYVVDFGVPDESDQLVRLEHYVHDYLPSAVNAVCAHAGSEQVSFFGYCMGGIFSLLYTAAHHPQARRGLHTARTRNIVTAGAPINFEKMGVLGLAARFGHGLVDRTLDVLGNVPSVAAEAGFKLMGGTRTVTKWVDLARNLYDEQYVRGFDAINTWVNDLLPYPREAFKQVVREMIGQNKLLKRQLELAGQRIDLGLVDVPLLAMAGKSDNIAPLASTRDVLEGVGSADKTFVEVPGGHVGVINGASAPTEVWDRAARWLAPRSLATPLA